jgi:transcriptional regulator with XRE-family HTH domain
MSKAAKELAQKLAAYNDPLADIPDSELEEFRQDFRQRARGFKGDRLRELRESKGITLTQLAQFSGVAQNAIEEMEKGERQPEAKVAQALAEALGTKKSYFYDAQEVKQLKQAADLNKQADKLIDRLTKYKASRGLQYTQLRAALERAGAKVNLPTMKQWIAYHHRPSERFIEPVNKALDMLEKEPVQEKKPAKPVAIKQIMVYLIVLRDGTKLIAAPEDKDGHRQLLYTFDGKPCRGLKDVAEQYTKTEQELFGRKIRPGFNKGYIEAEIPTMVQVPTDQRWSREISL